ncbi:hypothetical protein Moror_10757 [Moniliophthora roreri MCA 2997]|uniref:Uncharacterized protein n=1 Tax=Moniliophthora roreri (strain MCA 2997) TaxID=1381753 RepID=V2WMH3_MONRO|nr:hypothetical protein Moror_10757 [Moniliophthora roreri MCA 2997]
MMMVHSVPFEELFTVQSVLVEPITTVGLTLYCLSIKSFIAYSHSNPAKTGYTAATCVGHALINNISNSFLVSTLVVMAVFRLLGFVADPSSLLGMALASKRIIAFSGAASAVTNAPGLAMGLIKVTASTDASNMSN